MPGATTAPLHRLTYLSTRRTIYSITYTNPAIGASLLLFRPPDDPAFFIYPDTSPAIARTSLLQLEIAAGISHQELTPISHSRHPLARRKPHCHYTMVCVIYVYLTLNLFHTITIVGYIRLPVPFTIQAICRIRCIPCYTPITVPHHFQFLGLILSCRPLRSSLN